jgi:hypothetical protein
VTESLVSSGTIPGGLPFVQKGASIASSPERRPTADGYSVFKPPDRQLQPESSDFEARRLRNELSILYFALGGAPYETHPGEWQDALAAIFLYAMR